MHRPKLDPNQALAIVINVSLAAGYLTTALAFNRLMKILEYVLKTQMINDTIRVIPTRSKPTPPPYSASMFPFQALLNKRKRPRVKSIAKKPC
ncbi:MAG: hypothetical protein P8M25_07810 [Paracoccaceae bacterium]|nr:hypothetical protein [Paracoccaceae bacterium]